MWLFRYHAQFLWQSSEPGPLGWLYSLVLFGVAVSVTPATPQVARAIGEGTAVDVRRVEHAGAIEGPRESAARRLAWELRKRTSIDPRLDSTSARLDDPDIFATPFLYWTGDRAFPPLSEPELTGLRRFIEYGGFLLVDVAAPEREEGFARSVRRALARAFPNDPVERLPADHVIYRSFYLLERPVGRLRGPDHLEGITRGERVAVVLSQHDLGGAWARDELGNWLHRPEPGGERQREHAYRLGVNLVMYALCLDYKDDQVHAPFIMRRRSRAPREP